MTKRIRIIGERRAEPDIKKLAQALLLLAHEWARQEAEANEPRPRREGRRR